MAGRGCTIRHLPAIGPTHGDRPNLPIVLSIPTVAVPAYSVPANAPQSGTAIQLDTLDARFQNRSTQVGDPFLGQITSLWNVHAIGQLATLRYYRIRLSGAGAPALEEMNVFFASGPSSDFNPSIAANFAKGIAVNWSSTCAVSGCAPIANAQVRAGSKPNGGAFTQALVFQSTPPLVGNGGPPVARWGDYSYSAIDPTNPGVAWGVNEEIDNPDDSTGGTWGTRFFNSSIP